MSLEITGKLIEKLPEVSGTTRDNKSWTKYGFVIETSEQYPKKIAFDAWNEKGDSLQGCRVGDTITVGFNIESKESAGRYFTNLSAWKIIKVQMEEPDRDNYSQERAPIGNNDESDLPF